MRLRDDPQLLTIAVRRVADQTGVPAAHIEKDFWLAEALRRMAAVADAECFTLLFKGGTSLSKAFRLIERFSEDVDVLVVLPTGSTTNKTGSFGTSSMKLRRVAGCRPSPNHRGRRRRSGALHDCAVRRKPTRQEPRTDC